MTVNSVEAGEGKPGPIVMVHGAGGSTATWFMQTKHLSESLHTVAIDLNGHGATPDRETEDLVRSYLDDIDEVVSRYESPVLCGHSMGGALTQLYALEKPDSISAIVLVGTGARLRVTPIIFELLKEDFNGYVEMFGQFVFHEDTDSEVIEASKAQVRKCPAGVISRDYELCTSFDIMERVSDIELPTLVIVGEGDAMTPPKYSDYLSSKIAGSQLKIIPSAGHGVMLEQPEEFNRTIVEWFQDLGKI